MQITPNQTFLHRGERYESGETYEVNSALAGYFVRNGWATSPEIDVVPTPPPLVVDLDPHDVTQGQEAPHHG